MLSKLSATYQGKPGRPFEQTGSFPWNEAGNTVILAELKNRPDRYFLGENWVLQFDMEGNKIPGKLAEKYRLRKQ
jgi:copper homeostasis protein (lipoprotein)